MPIERQDYEPDVFRVDCGSRRVLDLIADTWSILVLYAIQDHPLRYSELHKKIEGISQKMLTQTLRQLERNGLIERVVNEDSSPKIIYTLSVIGEALLVPLREMCDWAETNLDSVEAAQQQYDSDES